MHLKSTSLICAIFLIASLTVVADNKPQFDIIMSGWSQTSKALVGIKADDPEQTQFQFHYKIVDLITDKVLYTKSFSIPYASYATGYAEETIKTETKQLALEVKKHQIKIIASPILFPDSDCINIDGSIYQTLLSLERSSTLIEKYSLKIRTSLKSKTITTQNVASLEVNNVWYATSSLANDKKRLCIVILEQSANGSFTLKLFGSHLTKGFE